MSLRLSLGELRSIVLDELDDQRRLTRSGRAMFSGWVGVAELDDGGDGA